MEKLTAQLKSGELERVYLLFGSEEYLIHFYGKRLTDKSVAPEDRFMNLCVLEGAEATADRIQESTDTYPFMGEKRVTLVKGSEWFSGKRNDAEGQEKLLALLRNLTPTTLLIFEEQQVDKRTALYKAVQKAGYAAELSQPDEEGMIRFVARELAGSKKMLSRETAQYFLQTVGGDMIHLQLELEKLAAYKGDEEIVTIDDVNRICTPQPESNVFRMTDALGERKRREAMRIYERLLENNEPPQRIYSLLMQQIRKLYRIRLCDGKRMSKEECAEFAGIAPRIVWLYQKQAARFSRADLERLLEEMTEMDEKIKLSQLEETDAIERLIASV